MIDIFPAEMAKGLQLVGWERSKREPEPVIGILGACGPEQRDGAIRLRALILNGGPRGACPKAALRDLVQENFPRSASEKASAGRFTQCPVCGKTGSSGILTTEGKPLCYEHLGGFWHHRLAERLANPLSSPCPLCGESTSILWKNGSILCCTPCLARSVLYDADPLLWVLTAGSPLHVGAERDLGIFLSLWRKDLICERCGSPKVRIHKIHMDFPKATGPLYPLWEMLGQARTSEEEARRTMQLEAYTRGLSRVTIECPQCGYLELEFSGTSLLESESELNHLSQPPPIY